jgi:hypothetical protein
MQVVADRGMPEHGVVEREQRARQRTHEMQPKPRRRPPGQNASRDDFRQGTPREVVEVVPRGRVDAVAVERGQDDVVVGTESGRDRGRREQQRRDDAEPARHRGTEGRRDARRSLLPHQEL